MSTVRLWHLPVPVRVLHTGFQSLGVTAPLPLRPKKSIFTLPVRSTPTIFSDAQKLWLVHTLTLSGGSFAWNPPGWRVDGPVCKGHLHCSCLGAVHMVNIQMPRACMTAMTDGVLAVAPDSRILVRLLPRYLKGSVRYYPDTETFQIWSAI